MRSNSPLILSSQNRSRQRGLLSPMAGTMEPVLSRRQQQPFSGPSSPRHGQKFDTYQDANNYLASTHYQVLQQKNNNVQGKQNSARFQANKSITHKKKALMIQPDMGTALNDYSHNMNDTTMAGSHRGRQSTMTPLAPSRQNNRQMTNNSVISRTKNAMSPLGNQHIPLTTNFQGGFMTGFFESVPNHLQFNRVDVKGRQGAKTAIMQNRRGQSLDVRGQKAQLQHSTGMDLQDTRKFYQNDQSQRVNDNVGKTVPAIDEMITNGMKNTFNLTKPKFGIKSYNVQDSYLKDHGLYKIPNVAVHKIPKNENDTFTDKHAKLTSWVPPAKYDMIKNWAKDPPFTTSAGRINGRFLPTDRKTTTEIFMKAEVKKNNPSPNHYKLKELMGGPKKDKSGDQQEKCCSFIEAAKWQGTVAPPHKFNPSYKEIDPKIRADKWKESDREKQNGRVVPIKKIKEVEKTTPAPGCYDTELAYRKSQDPKRDFKPDKSPRVNFTESHSKNKKFLPGVGHYKYEIGRTYDHLSGSPRSMATRRH